MSSVQCWKQPAFAVSTFSPNFPFHGEITPVKSGESGILSTISTMALALLFTPATILPHLLLRHPSPQQLRLFVAPNSPFWPFRRSCQVPQLQLCRKKGM
jgi:hypothetical protein